jgi:hypothetical protein
LIDYTNSRDINHRSIEYQEKTLTANTVRIDSITSKIFKYKKDASYIRCQRCRAINSVDGDDLLDLNGKRHFCCDADRIAHEEKCVTQIQKIIGHYNHRELSNFQLELNIP